MALYMDYHILRSKYHEAQMSVDLILSEKEKLFAKTQPRSIKFDSERVSGGGQSNPFEEYVIQLEKHKIDFRLNEAKTIMEDRLELMLNKEGELRASNDVADKIYCLRVLDRKRLQTIMAITHYSRSHIYRILHEIYENTKCETL